MSGREIREFSRLSNGFKKRDTVRPLVESIVQKIYTGELSEADKLPSLRQFAKDHGIPFRVAHSVFQKLGQSGFVRSVRGYGTYVCSQESSNGNRKKISREVHLILDFKTQVISYEARSLVNELQDNGFLPLVYVGRPAGEKRDRLVASLKERWKENPPAAIIIEGHPEYLDEAVLSSDFSDTKVIVAFRHPDTVYPGWHTIQLDRSGAHYSAAKYLLGKGHRRIGIGLKQLESPDKSTLVPEKAVIDNNSSLCGANQAIVEMKINDDGILQPFYFEYVKYPEHDYSEYENRERVNQTIQKTAQWLQENRDITGIVAQKPFMWFFDVAAHALKIKVPEELELVSIGSGDNAIVSDEFPHLDWNVRQIAREITVLITTDNRELNNCTRNIVIQAEWKQPALDDRQYPFLLRNGQLQHSNW